MTFLQTKTSTKLRFLTMTTREITEGVILQCKTNKNQVNIRSYLLTYILSDKVFIVIALNRKRLSMGTY